jgi:hypothetical protein
VTGEDDEVDLDLSAPDDRLQRLPDQPAESILQPVLGKLARDSDLIAAPLLLDEPGPLDPGVVGGLGELEAQFLLDGRPELICLHAISFHPGPVENPHGVPAAPCQAVPNSAAVGLGRVTSMACAESGRWNPISVENGQAVGRTCGEPVREFLASRVDRRTSPVDAVLALAGWVKTPSRMKAPPLMRRCGESGPRGRFPYVADNNWRNGHTEDAWGMLGERAETWNQVLECRAGALPGGARDPLRSPKPSKAPAPSQWAKRPSVAAGVGPGPIEGRHGRVAGSVGAAVPPFTRAPTRSVKRFEPSSAPINRRSATASAFTGFSSRCGAREAAGSFATAAARAVTS